MKIIIECESNEFAALVEVIQEQRKGFEKVLVDGKFVSGDPRIRQLEKTVEEIIAILNGKSGKGKNNGTNETNIV